MSVTTGAGRDRPTRLARRWEQIFHETSDRVFAAVAAPAHELTPEDHAALMDLVDQRARQAMERECSVAEWSQFCDWHSRLSRQRRSTARRDATGDPRWLRRYGQAEDRWSNGDRLEVLVEHHAEGFLARVSGWHSSAPQHSEEAAIADLIREVEHHSGEPVDSSRFTFRRITPVDTRRQL